jgi:acyl carrier protein
MTTRDKLRSYLFGTLLEPLRSTPEAEWPPDDADLFRIGLDSLKTMLLLIFVEEQMRVRLEYGDLSLERMRSVSALTEWIESSSAA